MSDEHFDALVDQALDGIPDELVADALDGIPEGLARVIDNVVVMVEEGSWNGALYGRYEGVALTERTGFADDFELPDRIFIYRGPLLDLCETEAELVEEVRITVVHEVAHHFGIDDDRLHDLGYA